MIYQLSQDLLAALRVRGCPVPVIYGPEPREPTALVNTRIVIERDREAGDSNAPPRKNQLNPKMHGVRAIGVLIRVFAQSTLAGAALHDHEELADQIVDMCLVALRKTASEYRTTIAWGPSKLLTPEELDLRGLRVPHGVCYEMKFAIDRGVYDRTWQGMAEPTADLEGFANRTNITDGAGPVEISCGAD